MPATVDERPRVILDPRTRVGPTTVAQLGILLAAVLGALWAVQKYGRHYHFFDLNIYHGAMVWWTHGGNLYDFVSPGTTLGFTYPPFAAFAMVPMAILPTAAAGWLNTAVSLAALALLLSWLLVPIADRYGWPRWFTVALAVPLAAATEPVRETLGFGQVNLLLAVLVYADFVALRNRARRAGRDADAALPAHPVRRLWASGATAGFGVGLATAIKLTPGLFVVYFVVTRQWRAALASAATAIGLTLMMFVVSGQDTITYFTSVVTDTAKIGAVDATANQALSGLLARLYDSPTTPTLMWLAFDALILAVGLSRAKTAHAEGDELTSFTLVGLTANAVCPISWSHHLVFLVPALVILGDTALRRRAAARALAYRGPWTRGPVGIPALAGLRHAAAALGLYLIFIVSIWHYEHVLPKHSHYAGGLAGALGENSLALALIALVALLPWRPGAEPAFYAEPALAVRVTAS
jgi:alpha-1,2-mannosyltransferase